MERHGDCPEQSVAKVEQVNRQLRERYDANCSGRCNRDVKGPSGTQQTKKICFKAMLCFMFFLVKVFDKLISLK